MCVRYHDSGRYCGRVYIAIEAAKDGAEIGLVTAGIIGAAAGL